MFYKTQFQLYTIHDFFNYFLQSVSVWTLSPFSTSARVPRRKAQTFLSWATSEPVCNCSFSFIMLVSWSFLNVGRWPLLPTVLAEGDCQLTGSFEDLPPLRLLSGLLSRSSTLSAVVFWYSWTTAPYSVLFGAIPGGLWLPGLPPSANRGTRLNAGVPQREDYRWNVDGRTRCRSGQDNIRCFYD